jgi:hypothetical protein
MGLLARYGALTGFDCIYLVHDVHRVMESVATSGNLVHNEPTTVTK